LLGVWKKLNLNIVLPIENEEKEAPFIGIHKTDIHLSLIPIYQNSMKVIIKDIQFIPSGFWGFGG